MSAVAQWRLAVARVVVAAPLLRRQLGAFAPVVLAHLLAANPVTLRVEPCRLGTFTVAVALPGDAVLLCPCAITFALAFPPVVAVTVALAVAPVVVAIAVTPVVAVAVTLPAVVPVRVVDVRRCRCVGRMEAGGLEAMSSVVVGVALLASGDPET